MERYNLSVIFWAAIQLILIGTASSQCTSNQCSKPTPQAGLTITTDKNCYDGSETITYACAGTSFGPGINICDGSNGWRYSQPVCTATAISCDVTFRPDHGSIVDEQDSYSLYDTLDYACDTGYTLVGTERIVCDMDGAFKPSYNPSCVESLALPQTSQEPGTTVFTSSSSEPRSSPMPSVSSPPYSTRKEPSSLRPSMPPKNWNGLIIGLCVGVGGGLLIVIVVLMLAQCYWKNSKRLTISPDDQEMNPRDSVSIHSQVDVSYCGGVKNKSFSETWQ